MKRSCAIVLDYPPIEFGRTTATEYTELLLKCMEEHKSDHRQHKNRGGCWHVFATATSIRRSGITATGIRSNDSVCGAAGLVDACQENWLALVKTNEEYTPTCLVLGFAGLPTGAIIFMTGIQTSVFGLMALNQGETVHHGAVDLLFQRGVEWLDEQIRGDGVRASAAFVRPAPGCRMGGIEGARAGRAGGHAVAAREGIAVRVRFRPRDPRADLPREQVGMTEVFPHRQQQVAVGIRLPERRLADAHQPLQLVPLLVVVVGCRCRGTARGHGRRAAELVIQSALVLAVPHGGTAPVPLRAETLTAHKLAIACAAAGKSEPNKPL